MIQANQLRCESTNFDLKQKNQTKILRQNCVLNSFSEGKSYKPMTHWKLHQMKIGVKYLGTLIIHKNNLFYVYCSLQNMQI